MNWEWLGLVVTTTVVLLAAPMRRHWRTRRYTRGRRTGGRHGNRSDGGEQLRFGNARVNRREATQHFLFVGTSGSGKSLLQRRLLADVLPGIQAGTDRRCLILDAKQDMVPFLRQIGVDCPVYSLNPLESRSDMPTAVAWDVAADITSPSRALNFVAGLFPEERGGSNRFWTDSGRHVVTGLVESFIRHAPAAWRFADLVYASLSLERIRKVLNRDQDGQEILDAFLKDDDTAYKVHTTIVSRMSYYRSVAALWQRLPRERAISIRRWLTSESILLLGCNATMQAALDPINELIFRVFVEEVDAQSNSTTRETWAWIDEARLAGALLRGERLAYYAAKARSKGGILVLSFQDIEGFRHASGSAQLADEMIAQCSHKMLGRMESEQSARWAAGLCGQYETKEWFESESQSGRRSSRSLSAQRVTKDHVLASEFYSIHIPSRSRGVRAAFLTPTFAAMETVPGHELVAVVSRPELDDDEMRWHRPEHEQRLAPWSGADRRRLLIERPLGLPGQLERPIRIGYDGFGGRRGHTVD